MAILHGYCLGYRTAAIMRYRDPKNRLNPLFLATKSPSAEKWGANSTKELAHHQVTYGILPQHFIRPTCYIDLI